MLSACMHTYSSSMAAARNGTNWMPWSLIGYQHVVVSPLRCRDELFAVLHNTMYRRLADGDPSFTPMYGPVRNFSRGWRQHWKPYLYIRDRFVQCYLVRHCPHDWDEWDRSFLFSVKKVSLCLRRPGKSSAHLIQLVMKFMHVIAYQVAACYRKVTFLYKFA